MSRTPLERIRLPAPPGWDWRLDRYHNTAHATERHASLSGRSAREVASPWLHRFDWVLDRHPETPPGQRGPVVLAQRHDHPRSVFVRSGELGRFHDEVLPLLERPVVLYVGNAEHPLSEDLPGLHRVLGQPMVHAVFAESKDLDLPSVTAMPVGIHPVDLLADDGAQRLERLAASVVAEDKRARVLEPWGPALARFGLQAEAPVLSPQLASSFCVRGDAARFWELLAAYRFVLVPPGADRDSALPAEALALGTIPILRRGPLAEAYEGLPVVTVEHASEITDAALDGWWERHRANTIDRGFPGGEWWWRKVTSALPERKRAYLVVGPESHGNHFVTDLLVSAGCHGHSGRDGTWAATTTSATGDTQPWDTCLPQEQNPVVWRRSVPHLRAWPDLSAMARDLRARGYVVHALVVHRDRFAAVRSQVERGHVPDHATARANIERAYAHIAAHLAAESVSATHVTYEALVTHAAARVELLQELSLAAPDEHFPVLDGNWKWHEAAAGQGPAIMPEVLTGAPPATPPAATATSPAERFPDHWFPCAVERRVSYDRTVANGRARMRDSRAVLCGLARDVAPMLSRTIAMLGATGALFRDHRVVLYESHSVDSTLDTLRAWQRDDPRVDLLSDAAGMQVRRFGRDPRRMRHLAACRNRYLEHVVDRYADYDYAIVVDTDLRLGFSLEGLAHTFGEEEWDAVGSNGLLVPREGRPPPEPQFFDAWAFRRVGETRAADFAEINALYFRRGEPLLRVWSAFGGLAVYTMAAFASGARYVGDDCEHVAFHRGLRGLGYDRIYMNPSQISLYCGDD